MDIVFQHVGPGCFDVIEAKCVQPQGLGTIIHDTANGWWFRPKAGERFTTINLVDIYTFMKELG